MLKNKHKLVTNDKINVKILQNKGVSD